MQSKLSAGGGPGDARGDLHVGVFSAAQQHHRGPGHGQAVAVWGSSAALAVQPCCQGHGVC